jgi:hypothetical protein
LLLDLIQRQNPATQIADLSDNNRSQLTPA